MNILFVNLHQPERNHGGIETVTGLLAKEFSNEYSHECYNLWKLAASSKNSTYEFKDNACINLKNRQKIATYLKEWSIDIIIVQAFNESIKPLKETIERNKLNIKIVYVLHSEPGWEFNISTWENVKRLSKIQGIRGKLKLIAFPLFRYLQRKKIYNTYRHIYKDCDSFVLLSEKARYNFIEKFRIWDTVKSIVIENPTPYSIKKIPNTEIIQSKKNSVLIVSRLFEFDKRISLALKVWSKIESSGKYKDWELTIVGTGNSIEEYEKYVMSKKLTSITFKGRQNPVGYYKSAKIFLMTSKFEGWALTLVESQTYGCVPIAFDSFSSASTIIQNGENGCLIADNDLNSYQKHLESLMNNPKILLKMQEKAMESSQKYSVHNIGLKWNYLFRQLIPNNH